MRKFLVFLICCIPLSPVYAQVPYEVSHEVGDEELIKDKQWNRWTTNNFVICSISNPQAEYLDVNVENIKKWLLTRWGFHDIPFEKECRVIAVDDPKLYSKFFKLTQSYVKKDKDYNVVFILLDDKPSKTVPIPLTEVCLIEFEEQHDVKFGWWAHRGIALLNGHLGNIREALGNLYPYLEQDHPMFFSKALFATTQKEWQNMTSQQRELFDSESIAMCLLLRKEFGQTKFLRFLKDSYKKPEETFQREYGFNDYAQMDATFKRYMENLSSDILQKDPNRPLTPDSYLQVTPP